MRQRLKKMEDEEEVIDGDEENIQITPLTESCCLGRRCLDMDVVFSVTEWKPNRHNLQHVGTRCLVVLMYFVFPTY